MEFASRTRLLADCLALAVNLAGTQADLVEFWRLPGTQGALRQLEAAEVARVVEAKDRRKAALAKRS